MPSATRGAAQHGPPKMMTTSPFSMGNAASDLGLDLPQQLQDETEEQRKKRLLAQQQRAALGPAAQMLGTGMNG